MHNMFDGFPTEKVKLIKKNGEILNNINALVERKKIFISDATVPIEEDDIIERSLPTGSFEQFVVVDRGFFKGMGGIPDHYQVSVEKVTKRLTNNGGAGAGNVYNFNNASGKININSEDNSINITLSQKDEELFDTLKKLAMSLKDSNNIVKNIDDMHSTVGKASFIEKYNAFIQSIANHITIFAPFIPALTSLLGK